MNTEDIRAQARVLDDLRKQRDAVVLSQNTILAVKCGQATAKIFFAGVAFDVTGLNRAYMPEVISGMKRLQAECVTLLQFQIDILNSKIIGAENKLKKLCKRFGEK